jgi:hypothetical protein
MSVTVLWPRTLSDVVRSPCRWFNSPRQWAYRVIRGLTEFFLFAPPVKRSAYIGAKQPELETIHFINR